MLRRPRGFTLIELLVSLFALALLASLSWRGLDGMMRARRLTEARSDAVLALQTGLAQWTADLDAIVEFPPSPALDWNGRVLRLVRRSSLAAGDGVRVVGWTRREGRWLRWQSGALTTRGELQAAWAQADLWSQNPSDALRRQEVPIAPLNDWQVFFYRGDAWTNPLSSDSAAQNPSQPRVFGSTIGSAPVLPEGVRIVLDLPPGPAFSGRLQKDWIRPTVGGGKS